MVDRFNSPQLYGDRRRDPELPLLFSWFVKWLTFVIQVMIAVQMVGIVVMVCVYLVRLFWR